MSAGRITRFAFGVIAVLLVLGIAYPTPKPARADAPVHCRAEALEGNVFTPPIENAVLDGGGGHHPTPTPKPSPTATPIPTPTPPPPLASVGNFVWIDQNGNGFQDDGEPGLGGVQITLYDQTDTAVNAVSSSADGSYMVSTIPPSGSGASYYLRVDLKQLDQLGYSITKKSQNVPNSNDLCDSDFNTLSGKTDVIPLQQRQMDRHVDLGLIPIPVCRKPLDLMIVLDGSGSISLQNFALLKAFAASVAQSFDIGSGLDKTQIGVTQFALDEDTRTDIPLNQYQSKDALVDGINGISKICCYLKQCLTENDFSECPTDIEAGLAVAAHQFITAADRPSIPNAILLLSDGADDIPNNDPVSEAKLIQSKGIEIFAVRIASDSTNTAAVALMKGIANTDTIPYYFEDVGDQSDLISSLGKVISGMCDPVISPATNYYTSAAPTLTWNRADNATYYDLEVAVTTDFAAPLISNDQISAETLMMTLPTLSNGVYYWHVRAQTSDGNWGRWSQTQSFTIAVPP